MRDRCGGRIGVVVERLSFGGLELLHFCVVHREERFAGDRIHRQGDDDIAVRLGPDPHAVLRVARVGEFAIRVGGVKPVGDYLFPFGPVEVLRCFDEHVLVTYQQVVNATVVDGLELGHVRAG